MFEQGKFLDCIVVGYVGYVEETELLHGAEYFRVDDLIIVYQVRE